MARQVAPVIRDEDPEAKVVSAPYTFIGSHEQILSLIRSDVVNQFDVISWHPFYDAIPEHESFGNYYYEYPLLVQEIREMASANGFTGEYWGTDLSWDSYEGAICDSLECRLQSEHPWDILKTNLQAAKYYARVIVMELGLDLVVGLDGFTDDASRRWSYATMVNLNTVMAGNEPLEIPVEIDSDAAPIASYGFSLPNDDSLFAIWNDGVAVDYDPGVPSTLTFPDTSAKRVIGIDVLHGFEQELIIEMENGNLVIRNFLIKDYPIILRLVD